MTTIKIGRKAYTCRTILVMLALVLLIFFELRGGRSSFDEILGLLAMGYVGTLCILHRLTKDDLISVLCMAAAILIGLLSNLVSGLSHSVFSICIDIIAETKFLWFYFALRYFINKRVKTEIVNLIRPFVGFFIIGAFVCGCVSQVVSIGMTDGEGSSRYGLKSFRFFFPLSFQFLAVMLVILAVLVSSEQIKRKRWLYLLACVSLCLTTKSSPILFSAIFIFLLFYFRRRERLKTSTVMVLAALVICLGTFQIKTYLLNENAPRYLFFSYGAKTANTYFPLGSGFSTFGSDQAARVYSPLYYQYGFHRLFGMNTKDGSFLSDTFWPMGIAQFGWIGFVLYTAVYVRIFLSFRKTALGRDEKAFVYAAYLQYMVHAVGSAILSSAAGMIGVVGIALVMYSRQNQKAVQPGSI
ncbi:MAG: hypothetical protein LKE53_10600 [Oscillospiraceae bacterium]|jgi:hypothetical protein|nr:hypothetical protein [Oscillospiraceae bacterium]MDD3260379.1 hypothetical protein [Oscillospiraceae bacterium]